MNIFYKHDTLTNQLLPFYKDTQGNDISALAKDHTNPQYEVAEIKPEDIVYYHDEITGIIAPATQFKKGIFPITRNGTFIDKQLNEANIYLTPAKVPFKIYSKIYVLNDIKSWAKYFTIPIPFVELKK